MASSVITSPTYDPKTTEGLANAYVAGTKAILTARHQEHRHHRALTR
jgi:hypothetical protein